MNKKDKRLIRVDLTTHERLENLERAVFNIGTCCKCNKDFNANEVSANNKYKIPTCFYCFCKMLDKDRLNEQR